MSYLDQLDNITRGLCKSQSCIRFLTRLTHFIPNTDLPRHCNSKPCRWPSETFSAPLWACPTPAPFEAFHLLVIYIRSSCGICRRRNVWTSNPNCLTCQLTTIHPCIRSVGCGKPFLATSGDSRCDYICAEPLC